MIPHFLITKGLKAANKINMEETYWSLFNVSFKSEKKFSKSNDRFTKYPMHLFDVAKLQNYSYFDLQDIKSFKKFFFKVGRK